MQHLDGHMAAQARPTKPTAGKGSARDRLAHKQTVCASCSRCFETLNAACPVESALSRHAWKQAAPKASTATSVLETCFI